MRTPLASSSLALGPHLGPLRAVCRSLILALSVMLLAASTTACGAKQATNATASPPVEINVFAAATLTEAFGKIATEFGAIHPNVNVTFNFAGSQTLAAQIEQGAPADVFASASPANMDAIASLVDAPRPFAADRLEIVVEKGNPKHIGELADLARSDLKVVLGEPFQPAGKAALKVLAAQHVTVKPVSLEDTVKGVVTKVSMGEADAGIVWVTDVQAARDSIAGVPIPDDQNVVSQFPIAVVRSSKLSADAHAFVEFVLSTHGQQVLHEFGFLPPSTK